MRRGVALLSLVILCAGAPYENRTIDGEVFNKPVSGLDETLAQTFRAGGGLFRRAWLIGPSQDQPEASGLGPLYNRLSCIACHAKNGRGSAPDPENGVARSIIVRLGVAGRDAHGGPLPHPVYGAQLNPEGIPGVPGEGRAIVTYEEFIERLADGSTIAMRRPRLSLLNLGYGLLDPSTKISVRNAPPVFGLGFLEAVTEEQILAYAVEIGGGKGHANYVYDIESDRRRLGRFGLKANQPTLKQQIANAFAEDLGVTNDLFPDENCTPAQTACTALVKRERRIELSASQLRDTVDYIRDLAPPARRDVGQPEVKRGEAIFSSLGCAVCHRESMRLGVFPPNPAISGATIHPYTDLLVHDMGDGLADGREDYGAGPRDWRTPPLWGLGLAGKYGDGANYLHDGRARTFAEAILWHGGEAQSAADAFRLLPKDERDALLAFLNSL